MNYSDCLSFASTLADFHDGGSVTPEYPLRSATLPGGERVQVVIPPATEKDTVSITTVSRQVFLSVMTNL